MEEGVDGADTGTCTVVADADAEEGGRFEFGFGFVPAATVGACPDGLEVVEAGVDGLKIRILARMRTVRCCAAVVATQRTRKKRYWTRMGKCGTGLAEVWAAGSASMLDHVRYTSKSNSRVPSRTMDGSNASSSRPRRLKRRCL